MKLIRLLDWPMSVLQPLNWSFYQSGDSGTVAVKLILFVCHRFTVFSCHDHKKCNKICLGPFFSLCSISPWNSMQIMSKFPKLPKVPVWVTQFCPVCSPIAKIFCLFEAKVFHFWRWKRLNRVVSDHFRFGFRQFFIVLPKLCGWSRIWCLTSLFALGPLTEQQLQLFITVLLDCGLLDDRNWLR